MYEKIDFDRRVEKLADSAEAVVAGLKDNQSGIVSAMFNLDEKDRRYKLNLNHVAAALEITKTNDTETLWVAVVERLAQDGHPQAPRLQAVKDWRDRFWTEPDVSRHNRNANFGDLISAYPDIRNLAHDLE